jgi:lambda family phage portal protein
MGTGIVPRLRIGEIDDPRRARDRGIWEMFCDNCDPEGRLDFYGQINVGARAMFESGEFLIRKVVRPQSWKLPIPLQMEILEGDYIASAKNEVTATGGAIIAASNMTPTVAGLPIISIKITPAAILSRHASALPNVCRRSEIQHVFQVLRPGQSRGISMFAPVVMTLRDIGDYRDAELMRKKIAACFAAFVTKPSGVSSPLASTTTTDAKNARIENFRPGMIQYLAAGEEVEFGSPPSADGYVDYMKDQLRAVAVGCGITYEMLTGDLSGTNYSSIRAGMIDFWEIVDQVQWLTFVPQICKPIWSAVGKIAAIAGLRAAGDPWSALWTPPGRRFIDPGKDADAEREAVRAGQKSLPSSIAASGEDPDEVVLEASRFNAILDKYGIVWDSDPRKVGRSSAAQPAAGTISPSA